MDNFLRDPIADIITRARRVRSLKHCNLAEFFSFFFLPVSPPQIRSDDTIDILLLFNLFFFPGYLFHYTLLSSSSSFYYYFFTRTSIVSLNSTVHCILVSILLLIYFPSPSIISSLHRPL